MRFALFFLLTLLPAFAAIELEPRMRHLRSVGEVEWDEFKSVPLDGTRLDYTFTAEKNTNDWTLFLRQRDVKVVWWVQLNGKTITNLFLSEDDLVHTVVIPSGLLKAGTNQLSIVPPKERDEIDVGEIRLVEESVKYAVSQIPFKIRVTEKGKPLPCRVTLVNASGALAPFTVEAAQFAYRPGVVYLGDGQAIITAQTGIYTVYVGRGFEYSTSAHPVRLMFDGRMPDIKVELKREVNTKGYVASDTHVHTFTWSRHGDATDEERAITLAAEGIELPIATDHNLVIDPVAPAKKTGMDRYFTPVYGNEVTTGHAHFNLFPLQPGGRAANWRIDDWPDLMKELRATGAKVIILNHPRNIHNKFQPFASTNFNAKTGENLRGPEFSFDCVEVVNSSALQTDWMINFTDWMALLNYGYKVTGVGSSDCHDVSRYIVGQGRTYVAADDADSSRINIDAATESFLKGRALISMGLFADIKMDGKYTVGALAPQRKDSKVVVTVQGPGWTAVDRVQLFANGELLHEEKFAPIYKPGVKKRIEWKLPNRGADMHLVVIASGPPVTGPFWRIPKPYQPTSTTWNPRVIGATNPIYVDADGDGKFTPPRLQK